MQLMIRGQRAKYFYKSIFHYGCYCHPSFGKHLGGRAFPGSFFMEREVRAV